MHRCDMKLIYLMQGPNVGPLLRERCMANMLSARKRISRCL